MEVDMMLKKLEELNATLQEACSVMQQATAEILALQAENATLRMQLKKHTNK